MAEEVTVMEPVEEDDGEYNEKGELMFSVEGGPRIFMMNSSGIKTIMGILIDETDDSFLVALPARLIDSETGIQEVHPFIPVPFLRLQKSAVMFVTHLFEPFGKKYKAYVEADGFDIYPESVIWLEDWKDGYEPPNFYDEEAAPAVSHKAKMEAKIKAKEAPEPELEVSGMSNAELATYLNSRKP